MRIFLIKLFSLLLLPAVLISGYWWHYEAQIQAVNLPVIDAFRVSKLVALLNRTRQPSLIIAGESRAGRHVDARIFESAGIPTINAATSAADLWETVKQMEWLELNKRPIHFVFSINISHVNDGLIEEGHYSPEMYFAFTPWERLKMFKSRFFLDARKNLKKAEHNVDYDQKLTSVIDQNLFVPDLGFEPFDAPYKQKCIRHHFTSHVATGDFEHYKDLDLNGAKWRLFVEAVNKLSQWRSQITMYLSPIPPSFRKCISGTIAEDADWEFSQKVAALVKGRANIRFVDFEHNPIPELESDKFYVDRWHLNPQGAEIFSRILLSRLTENVATPRRPSSF